MKLLLLITLIFSSTVFADEGMWTLNNFPKAKVKQKYKFDVTDAWLNHVRLSSARLAGGCSASFVSANGLVMTNHHCAHSCIEQLSKSSRDYVATGFYAKKDNDEVKCPEIEVNRLVEMTDVTKRITAATGKLKGKEYNEALKGTMSTIEKECAGESELVRCDVVNLYHGGQYQLYKYQRYQDVRLVFAPELAIAFFGGDPDNFNFPRYDLDVSFLRVYENGKPLKNAEYFKWSKDGAAENELTFVTGHPGSTSRLLTISQLEYLRDYQLPRTLMYLAELRGYLTEFAHRGPEQKRIAETRLFGIENSFKALKGRREALVDRKFFDGKISAEKDLRRKITGKGKWKKDFGSAWDDMTGAYKDLANIAIPLNEIEYNDFGSRLFSTAKTLVRASGELPKENSKRFREFADSSLPQLKQRLFSEAPIYEELEIAMMTFSLTKMREELGADHEFVKKVLGKKSPTETAEFLIRNTKLKDQAVRKKLFDGGQKEIEASKDPLIQFALAIDSDSRAIRTKYEDGVEPRIRKASEQVAQAQFAVFGSGTYPDATFTLRASYGQVKGYNQRGEWVKPITTMAGAYERNTGSDPYALPESWLKAKDKVNLQTPMNLCTTNDIIGGNSGSPMINKNAEVVGLIFDGNIQSLGGDYGFDETVNRAVAVHSSALIEALKNIYGAQRIVDEIQSSQ